MSSAISIPEIEDYLNFNTEIKSSVQGRYKWEVLYDPTTSILNDPDLGSPEDYAPDAGSGILTKYSSNGWHPNLILDSGLDKIARMAAAQVSQWCEAGTSDKPVKVCYSDIGYDGSAGQGVYVVSKDYTDITIGADNINIPWDIYPTAEALAIFINIPELTKEHEGSLVYWQGNPDGTTLIDNGDEKAQFKVKFVNTYEEVQSFTGGTYQFAVVDTGHVNYKVPGSKQPDPDDQNSDYNWYKTNTNNDPIDGTHGMYQFYHFFTQQTQLVEPYKMSQFYVEGRDETSGSVFCGTEVTLDGEGNIENITFTRTYDFYMELTPVTYRELGWMESPAAETLFSRIVLDNPIHLVAGQFLRVSYQLKVYPTTSNASKAPDGYNGLDANTWGGRAVQISSTGGWESDDDTDLLTGLEKIQHIGMCIVTDTGVAEPYDESGLSGEIFATGSSHFGPGYGYPNRWRTGTLPRQHPASITVNARAINPFTGAQDVYPSDTVEFSVLSAITYTDTHYESPWVNNILKDNNFLYIDSKQYHTAVILGETWWSHSSYQPTNIETQRKVTFDRNLSFNNPENVLIYYDLEVGNPIVTSQDSRLVGYLSENKTIRAHGSLFRANDPGGNPWDSLKQAKTLTVPLCDILDLYPNYPTNDPDAWDNVNIIDTFLRPSNTYKTWSCFKPMNSLWCSGGNYYRSTHSSADLYYITDNFNAAQRQYLIPIDSVQLIGQVSQYTILEYNLPIAWEKFGTADPLKYVTLTGRSITRNPYTEKNETYELAVACDTDNYHNAWVGAMFNYKGSDIQKLASVAWTQKVYYAYRESSHTISCDIDLTGIEMVGPTPDKLVSCEPGTGGKNKSGAVWRNVGGLFVDDPNSVPNIKVEIIRKHKIKDGMVKNGIEVDRLGQKLSNVTGHQLSLVPKNFFDLKKVGDAVTGGLPTGIAFYDLETEFDEVFETLNTPETIDISALLKFKVTVNVDGTLDIENTAIDPKLYTAANATGPDDITLFPGDEIKLTLEDYIVAGKIGNAGPVWEYARPDENPHILGGDAFNPPYLRPIYQKSPLKNYLPRVKNDQVFQWNNGGGLTLTYEKDALQQWTAFTNINNSYTGSIPISIVTQGGSGGGGSMTVKPALKGISTYYNEEYRSDFMEPIIKYDPLEQCLGAMWDPVAHDPSFVPQPAQLDGETSQPQIWIIDENGVGDGQVKWPTYYDKTNSGTVVPVYISADPSDDSILYITTSALSATFQYSLDVFPVKSEFPLEKTLASLGSNDHYQKLLNQEYYQIEDIIRYEVDISDLKGTVLQNLWNLGYTETFELIDSTRDTLIVSTKGLHNADNKINPNYLNTKLRYDARTGSLTGNDNFQSNKPESTLTYGCQSQLISGTSGEGWQDVSIRIKRVVGSRALYNKIASNVVYWPNWNMPSAKHSQMTGHPLANSDGISPASRLAGDNVSGASIFLSTVGALSSGGGVIDDPRLVELRKLKKTGSFSGDRSGREFPLNSNTALVAWSAPEDGLTTWTSVQSALSGSSIEVPLYMEPYQPGSCKLIKHGQFESSFANKPDWCVLGIGPSTSGTVQDMRESFSAARWPHYVFLFDKPQEKLNTHILRATFKYMWDREVALS